MVLDQAPSVNTQTWHDLGNRTARHASLIAQYLTTRWQSKRHGSYAIYEDDKLSIWLDTYHPTVWVRLATGVLVLEREGSGSLVAFHPGHWLDYLEPLAERAAAAAQEEDEYWQRKRAAIRQARSQPVNDAALFGVQS